MKNSFCKKPTMTTDGLLPTRQWGEPISLSQTAIRPPSSQTTSKKVGK